MLFQSPKSLFIVNVRIDSISSTTLNISEAKSARMKLGLRGMLIPLSLRPGPYRDEVGRSLSGKMLKSALKNSWISSNYQKSYP